MKNLVILVLIAVTGLVILTPTGEAQRRRPWFRGNVREIIRSLETDTDQFKGSLDQALDRSRLNGSRAEDEINDYVKKFEEATDRLRDRAEDRDSAPGLVRQVLNRGSSINAFMRRNRLGGEAETDWARVRNDLNRLANAYNVNWKW